MRITAKNHLFQKISEICLNYGFVDEKNSAGSTDLIIDGCRGK
jgi:hypothetical protein